MTKKQLPHVEHREDLIKVFMNARNLALVETVPECFGTLPQGNESAWAKGCKECPLYLHSNSCSKATHICDEIYWHKKRFEVQTLKDNCVHCGGAGNIAGVKRAKGGSWEVVGFVKQCSHCNGSGSIETYKFVELEKGARQGK